MFRLRAYLICTGIVASVIGSASFSQAENKPGGGDWLIDRELTASPQGSPSPALEYLLLPGDWEMKDGNAVPIYLRLAYEQSDASRQKLVDLPKKWNEMPVDKIPLTEAKKFLDDHKYMLRQIEIGARRRAAEWEYTLDEPHPIGLLLPDAQTMRSYAAILVLQVRVALAENDFAAATHHIQTGFGFARHVATGPTLINSLVGIAIASQFVDVTQELILRPGAPNLYWALAMLPRPFIGLRRQFGFEYLTFEKEFPELSDLDRPRSADDWDKLLKNVRTEIRDLAMMPAEGGKQKLPDWLPKDSGPDDPASKSRELTDARRHLAEARHLSKEQADAMPAAQVLLIHMLATFKEDRDNWFSVSYLPYPEARQMIDKRVGHLQAAPITEAHVPARTFLPGLDKVLGRQNGFERRLAAIRLIEALRMHAASHDGQLPEKLSDLVEAPAPDDPGTGKPFEYEAHKNSATIVSRLPDANVAEGAQRYKLTIRESEH